MKILFKICVLFLLGTSASGNLIAQSNPGSQKAGPSAVVFPVRSSANNRYLVDKNNKPFPILGRTSWFVISQSVTDYQLYLNNCLSLGYNSIEMHVLDHDPRGHNPPFNGANDLPFLKRLDGKDWTGPLVYTNIVAEAPDMTTPNEKYWTYVDTFLNYCESKGILVFFFPGYVGYVGSNQGWLEELIANGPSRSQAYGAWIAQRYKNQKNLVWMLLGDMGSFTISQRDAEAALIKGLKSIPDQQSVHYSSEANSGQNSTDQKDFGHEITLNGTYTWGHVSEAALGRAAYSRKPVIPAFLLEEPYDEEGPDGNSVNPHAIQPVRKYQWRGWLSTVGGYIAGNGYVWPFVEPHWKNHLDTQGSHDMARLNSFIRSIRWWDLVPSGLDGMRNLVTEGGGAETDEAYVSASATVSGDLLVAYIPPAHRGSITVDLTGMAKGLKASWYDPTTGTYLQNPGSPFANAGSRKFTPPKNNSKGQNDWALVIVADK